MAVYAAVFVVVAMFVFCYHVADAGVRRAKQRDVARQRRNRPAHPPAHEADTLMHR